MAPTGPELCYTRPVIGRVRDGSQALPLATGARRMSLAASPLLPFVRKLATHSQLGEGERQAILDLPARSHQIPANRDFVIPGERVEQASLVVDGLVGRLRQGREGNRQIVAVHIPGDMADLHSVVVPETISAMQALTLSTILRVPHSGLRRAAALHPAVAEAFWRESVVAAAILAEWVVNVGRRDSRARTAHLICEMAWRYGASGDRPSFRFPATQNHLADMLALTPVHVNRTLKGLRSEDIISLTGRTIEIIDWRRLADVADFDPRYLRTPERAGRRPAQAWNRAT